MEASRCRLSVDCMCDHQRQSIAIAQTGYRKETGFPFRSVSLYILFCFVGVRNQNHRCSFVAAAYPLESIILLHEIKWILTNPSARLRPTSADRRAIVTIILVIVASG